MSVQLIVYPQYFDGSGPLSSSSTELVVDGIDFNTVNTSSSTQSMAGTLPQAFIDANSLAGVSFLFVNTWYRFSGVASEVDESSGAINFSPDEGIIQRLSSLTFGATYDLTLDITANSTNIKVYQYKGDALKSTHTITGTGLQTISFNAYSTADIIAIYSVSSTAIIESISCGVSASTPSGVFTDLSNGQVICDLYEDEDLPLSLSVDDFKNAAEKVQSYSKAFNLPATKRNNQIFDNIFEVTRTDTGLNFNPYKKTKCILKQDGFLLFEGYLRLLDIQNKKEEISYNVNLYSEVVAFADVIDERTFSQLDFTELEHAYNRTQIIYSWNDTGTGITYTNPSTSGFRDANSTVKYPFVDWTHEILIGGTGSGTSATLGNPELPSLETAFRPFINIKYLIDRIFEATDFTYESVFFNTADFAKLYMDFNWGSDNAPVVFASSGELTNKFNTSITAAFTTLPFDERDTVGGTALNANFGYSAGVFTAQEDGQVYTFTYNMEFFRTASDILTVQWLVNGVPVNTETASSVTHIYSGNFTTGVGSVPALSAGDTVLCQAKCDSSKWFLDGVYNAFYPLLTPSIVTITTSSNQTTSDTILGTLRGELGQWDFLKGIMTMFNLVSLPDSNNPNNILIEPYGDIFMSSNDSANPNFFDDNSTELDWTEKIDVSEMKLTPLTDLNKKTIFKFVEDEDDFAFMNYKNQVGHLYGSKKYDASGFTILAGEDEIVAEPFAATVLKPLMEQFPDFITPAVYSMSDDNTSEGFENSPRIMYNNGIKTIGASYYIPSQNGVTSANEDEFLQFSHLSSLPPGAIAFDRSDFHFGECQFIGAVGTPTPKNLFNLYWLPYYNELYNPDTRIMTIKVNLSPSDISTFKMYDTVFIKNRTFRVNKIDYKPNDLAKVEFILIS
jgi:hypothetical protein